MPLLERTPPRKRMHQSNSPSSPQRMKARASNDGQRDEPYVFPSLDDMAAPIRNRTAATSSLMERSTPSLTSSSTIKRIAETSAGSGSRTGSSSMSSRVIGRPAGRNGPTLTSTISKSHPPIGATGTSSSQPISTDVSLANVSISKRVSPVVNIESTGIMRKEILTHQVNPDDRPIGRTSASHDKAVSSSAYSAFEAQMERALASGANPFQDRKRNQMRGEGDEAEDNRPLTGFLEVHSPLRKLQNSISPHPEEAYHSSPKAALVYSVRSSPRSRPDIAKAAGPSSPAAATIVHPSQPTLQAPRNPSWSFTAEEAARLQEQIELTQRELQSAREEARLANEVLQEKERQSRSQTTRIIELESRIFRDRKREGCLKVFGLAEAAGLWEAQRVKVDYQMVMDQDRVAKEIASIITRNRITFCDARRAVAELDAKQLASDLHTTQRSARTLKEQVNTMQLHVETLQRSKDEIEDRNTSLKEKAKEMGDLLKMERERCTWEEEKVKKMSEQTKDLRAELQRLKRHPPSSPSSMIRAAMTTEGRNKAAAAVVALSPPKASMQTKPMKMSRSATIGVRQSPRKTSHPIQAPTAVARDARSDIDNASRSPSSFSPEPVKRTTKSIEIAKTLPAAKKVAKPSRSIEQRPGSDSEEGEAVTNPKKKSSSILSRTKKTSEASAKTALVGKKGAKQKKVVEEARQRQAESDNEEDDDHEQMHNSIEQTPILTTKKAKKGKAGGVAAKAIEDDESDNSEIDATPVLRAEKSAASKAAKNREATQPADLSTSMTPMVPKKRAAAPAINVEEAAPAAAGAEKKKKRRMLKPTTNAATNFLTCMGDAEGDLDPKLNLPLQLSPLKPVTTITTFGGARSGAAAASRVFMR